MRIDDVLKTRSQSLLRDFEARHTLHDVVEVTSTKASHVLLGVYETQDGKWLARIQPAHLFDAKFRAGTFSLSIDQLDRLIEALTEMRETLSDKPANRVRIVQSGKRSPASASRQAAATVAQAPQPTAEDQVLVAIDRLARGLETVIGRLEALEAAVPQKDEQAEVEEQWARDIAWQVKHTQAPYDCPICGKEYKTRGRYLTHVAEEHGIAVEL